VRVAVSNAFNQDLVNRRPRISLIGASLSTNNLGVNALAVGTLRCVFHHFPDADVSLFDYDRQPRIHEVQIGKRTVQIPLVNIRFSKKPWQPNHIVYLLALAALSRLLPGKRLRARLLSGNRAAQHLLDADIIAAISGGDSFSDIYGYGRLFYVALPLILVILLGKELVLLPQTLGPFHGRMAKAVARFILSRAKVVYSRDFAGKREAERLLGSSEADQVRFNYDVGFALEPVPPQDMALVEKLVLREPGMALVGVNVSGLLYVGGYSKDNMFGLCVDYRQFVEDLIRTLVENCQAVVLLVPHVYGETPGSESDVVACREVYQQLSGRFGARLRLIDREFNESEVKFLIGRCDFFLGSRMHSCIAAISQGVPTVPIAYSDKFIGVMETVHVDSLVVDARKHSSAEILSHIESTFRNRVSVRQALTASMPAVQKDVLSLFDSFATARYGQARKELDEEFAAR